MRKQWVYFYEAGNPVQMRCQMCRAIIPHRRPSGGAKSLKVYREQKFCSIQCRSNLRGQESTDRIVKNKKCDYCQKILARKENELLCNWAKRKFCNIQCVGRNNAREYKLSSSGNRQRCNPAVIASRTGLERDKCNRCETTTSLQYHHKDRNFNNNNRSNLEVLCVPCHQDEHKKDPVSKKFIVGIARRSKAQEEKLRRRFKDSSCVWCGKSLWRLAWKRRRITGGSLMDTLKYKVCSRRCSAGYRIAKNRSQT